MPVGPVPRASQAGHLPTGRGLARFHPLPHPGKPGPDKQAWGLQAHSLYGPGVALWSSRGLYPFSRKVTERGRRCSSLSWKSTRFETKYEGGWQDPQAVPGQTLGPPSGRLGSARGAMRDTESWCRALPVN